MNMKQIIGTGIISTVLVVLLFISGISATATFIDPTPDNNSIVYTDYININTSITNSALETFVWNWNGLNTTFLNDSCVLHLSFNNNSVIGETNTVAVDNSKYKNNGSFTNGSTCNWTVNGRWNGAMAFDGINDNVVCGNDESLNLTEKFTIMGWIKPSEIKLAHIITKMSWAAGNINTGYYLRMESDGRIKLTVQHNGISQVYSNEVLSINEWYHVIGIFNGTHLKIYINGTLACTPVSATSPLGDIKQMLIGQSSNQRWFNGTMDEIHIYNRTLSSDEIKQFYYTNLKKYNQTQWYFETNQTNLIDDTYNYQCFDNDSASDYRLVTINAPGIPSITYPPTLSLWQRDTNNQGTIPIYGTYSGGASSISARFNNGNWNIINTSPANGIFEGVLTGNVGQGLLEVRCDTDTTNRTSVSNISIGDLFVIAGQSNFANNANNNQYLFGDIISTTYSSSWSNINGSKSGLPIILNNLIESQNIPISIIRTAIGATRIESWQKGNSSYDAMIVRIDGATNGSMKVKAMLFYQGESDKVDGTSYTLYKSYLNSMVSDFMSDTAMADKVLVGQIGQVGTTTDPGKRTEMDAIRKAQIDSWDTNPNIYPGATTYDIGILTPEDNVHFKTDEEIQTFGSRWATCVLSQIYGIGDGRGARVTNLKLVNNKLVITYNTAVTSSNYTLSDTGKPLGWRIIDNGTILNDSNITSVDITNNKITITLDRVMSTGGIVSYGSLHDAVGKRVVRSISNDLPMETLFNYTYTVQYTPYETLTITILDTCDIFNTTLDLIISCIVILTVLTIGYGMATGFGGIFNDVLRSIRFKK